MVEQISQNFPVTFHSMRTIDSIVQEHFGGHSPDFLKLDVQGYELEVLKGAEKSLPKMQVILAEVNLIDIHHNVPLLAELIAWLDARDWVAYDICGLTRRPLDRALWQADFIFVPRSSPLHSDKRSFSLKCVFYSCPNKCAIEPYKLDMKLWNPQYKTLDHWRGIAVLWVMIFHGFGTTYEKSLHPVVEFLKSLAAPGWLGVHIFFVISGYCISASIYKLFSRRRGYWDFIKDRAWRILPTYWLAFFLTLGLNLLSSPFNKTSFFQNFPPNWRAWVGNLFLIQPYLATPFYVVVYWSLVVEIGFYLVTIILLIISDKINPKIALFIGLLLTGACIFRTHTNKIAVFAYWPEFVCGALVFNALIANYEGKVYRRNLSLFLILMFGILNVWILQFHFSNLCFSAMFALILYLIYPIDSTLASIKHMQWLKFIGIISYSLYLLHVPFQGRVISLGLRIITDDSFLILPLQILGWCVAIIASYIFYQLVEKPFQDWRHSQKKPVMPVL